MQEHVVRTSTAHHSLASPAPLRASGSHCSINWSRPLQTKDAHHNATTALSSLPSERYHSVLQSIASTLLTEAGHSHHYLHDASVSDMREMVRQLLVVRGPSESSSSGGGDNDEGDEELFRRVDTLLELELKSHKTIVSAQEIPTVLPSLSEGDDRGFEQIALWKGDITTLKATAIVNAPNSAPLGCFYPSHKCIDNAIHSMAGPRLRAACHAIATRHGHEEPVGHAQITSGFALPVAELHSSLS
ncbi:unnamed protein product [Hyaloperonospora brassicae]|uniref:Macro domain-containing protein n=1 Tax=Hyaloperonospora brassicae TaxID=162125 RepID=A0AAV0T4X3_HYABA|nr:unnamed protein product [Hyaloperonospora brassicae]